jgi:hypothetical protein
MVICLLANGSASHCRRALCGDEAIIPHGLAVVFMGSSHLML